MDTRTEKCWDLEAGREVPKQDCGANKIDGGNCTGLCALAFKRGCFTVDRKFRDKCTRFVPSPRGGGR